MTISNTLASQETYDADCNVSSISAKIQLYLFDSDSKMTPFQ